LDEAPRRQDEIGSDEREGRRRLLLLVLVRAGVFAVLLLAIWLIDAPGGTLPERRHPGALWGLAGAVIAFTVAYTVRLRRPLSRSGLHAQIQILYDVLLASILVTLTGGVESPMTFLYALPVISATFFLGRRGVFWVAGLCCLILGALFLLENRGVLALGRPPPAGLRVAYLLMLNFSVFLGVAFLSGMLGEQLRRAGRELRKTEKSLERVKALHRDIVTSLKSGLVALDSEGRVSLINPVAARILGVEREEALSRPAVEILPALKTLLSQAPGARQDGSLRTEVNHRRTTDGREIPVGLTLSPLFHPDETPAGMLIHMQDLTELRAMEAVAKRAEQMAALGEMAAAVAHEIRNPLGSISGSVQMLEQSARLDEAEKKLLGIARRETERLSSLVNDFLLFARPRPPGLVETDLGGIVADTVEAFRASRSEGAPDIRIQPGEARARVDPDQFRQVLWNLLQNAADAAGPGGRVDIECRREDSWAILEVRDDGPGIPAEDRRRIFDPFFTTKEKGSGLGLAIISRIAEAHGGRVEYLPGDGRGSRFRVRFLGVGP
jgi:two-component system sensor histidine kinase PilS (NtrC family)